MMKYWNSENAAHFIILETGSFQLFCESLPELKYVGWSFFCQAFFFQIVLDTSECTLCYTGALCWVNLLQVFQFKGNCPVPLVLV